MESRSGRALQLDSEVQFLKGVGPVRARLLARVESLAATAAPEAAVVDAKTIERLEALGYAP